MEKNGKECETSKHRSYFAMQVLLLVLCAVVVFQFVLLVKCFATLNNIQNQLNTRRVEGKSSSYRIPRSEDHGHRTSRIKRGTDQTISITKALIKLEKLEVR